MSENKPTTEKTNTGKYGKRPELKIISDPYRTPWKLEGDPDPMRTYKWVRNTTERIHRHVGKGYQICTDPNVLTIVNRTPTNEPKIYQDCILMETSRVVYETRQKKLRESDDKWRQSQKESTMADLERDVKHPTTGKPLVEMTGDIVAEKAEVARPPAPSEEKLEQLIHEVSNLKRQLAKDGVSDTIFDAGKREMEEMLGFGLSNEKTSFFIENNPLAKDKAL